MSKLSGKMSTNDYESIQIFLNFKEQNAITKARVSSLNSGNSSVLVA